MEANEEADQLDIERREAEEAEMAAAMREVERLRLEMQRAADRIETAEGVDVEGTVVEEEKRSDGKRSLSRRPRIMMQQLMEKLLKERWSRRRRKRKRSCLSSSRQHRILTSNLMV